MRRSPESTAAFLTAQAERMRLAPTPQEQAMWTQLKPLGFLRQYVYCGRTKNGGQWSYILDFYRAGYCIEIDGGVHKRRRGRDRRRDTRMAADGIHTLRVTNREVEHDLDGVVARIKAALQ